MTKHDDSCKPGCRDSHDPHDHSSRDYWGGPDPEWPGYERSDGPCFIATAVYRDAHAPEVDRLREFRDAYLLQSAPGRLLVRVYYKASPPIARALSSSPALASFVRQVLDRLVERLPSRRPSCRLGGS